MNKSFKRLIKETSKFKAPDPTLNNELVQNAPDWIHMIVPESLEDTMNKHYKGFRKPA